MFNTINFSLPITDPANSTVRVTPLSAYFCPSDNMARTWTADSGYTLFAFGHTIFFSRSHL